MNLLSSGKPLKIKSKHSPLISTFLGHHTDTFATHTVHCLRKKKGYYVQHFIYTDIVPTDMVTSALSVTTIKSNRDGRM
jgi:hypothetical protein